MNSFNYIEVEGIPTAEPDLLAWAAWMETADRRVNETQLLGFRISTVFLGVDHGNGLSNTPVLYETMVFGNWLDTDLMYRYGTRRAALEGHISVADEVENQAKGAAHRYSWRRWKKVLQQYPTYYHVRGKEQRQSRRWFSQYAHQIRKTCRTVGRIQP